MKLPALFLSLLGVLLIAVSRISVAAGAAARASSRVADPEEDAERDALIGMGGLKQAVSDPKLLAQLMQDLQVRHLTKR